MIHVAGYCRVSTDKEDQANSFASQCRFFREYIDRNTQWQLYEIYADEGITGTSTHKRLHFNRMMDDAYAGRFQLILTKEVSRFSRNILDTIRFTRELKMLGIGVLFLTDGIFSLDADAELRLSIMGSIAQEESRKTSTRVKWGQARQMERGVVFGRSLLGYDVKNGKMTIVPEEARIVKRIFEAYAQGSGAAAIARDLEKERIPTKRANTQWNPSCIIKILNNEKYVGDLVQRKTVTMDYLTHARTSNRGQEQLICLTDHHEPIISRALWDKVHQRMKERDRRGGGGSDRYLFSGKIRCGVCGKNYICRSKKRKDGTVYRFWSCCGRQIGDDLARQMLYAALRSVPAESLLSKAMQITAEARKVTGAIESGRNEPIQSWMDRCPESALRGLLDSVQMLDDDRLYLRLRGMQTFWEFRLSK